MSENEIGNDPAEACALDIFEMLRPLCDTPGDVPALFDHLVAEILPRRPDRYVAVSVPAAPSASDPITARFLDDDFRDDLAAAAEKLLVGA